MSDLCQPISELSLSMSQISDNTRDVVDSGTLSEAKAYSMVSLVVKCVWLETVESILSNINELVM